MGDGTEYFPAEAGQDDTDWAAAEHEYRSDEHARSILKAIDEVGLVALSSSLRALGYQLTECGDSSPKKVH